MKRNNRKSKPLIALRIAFAILVCVIGFCWKTVTFIVDRIYNGFQVVDRKVDAFFNLLAEWGVR